MSELQPNFLATGQIIAPCLKTENMSIGIGLVEYGQVQWSMGVSMLCTILECLGDMQKWVTTKWLNMRTQSLVNPTPYIQVHKIGLDTPVQRDIVTFKTFIIQIHRQKQVDTYRQIQTQIYLQIQIYTSILICECVTTLKTLFFCFKYQTTSQLYHAQFQAFSHALYYFLF